jgi:hypothetical protein
MRWDALGSRIALVAAVVALGLAPQARAQVTAGVAVDAQGVLKTQVFADPGGRLTRQRAQAAMAALQPDLRKPSQMRMISLNRLEDAIRAKQGMVTDEMRYLAGLLRVRYVFLYPDSGDIVLAGPAEGWMTDLSGRVVGLTSGRPVVQLQDLAVALRAFPPDGKGARMVGCSIDPTQEGLAAMQRSLSQMGSHFNQPPSQAIANAITTELRTALGMQTISVLGVPADTHFAQVMVEADYRMKLIGIGLERPPVRMVSFVEKASPAQVSRNALFRWYFVPDYQCVRRTPDGLAMELVGDGVKLVGEDEMVDAAGRRRASGSSSRASKAFSTSFTEKYGELAEKSPVYAELRNCIDLLVAAAYMKEADLYGKAGWRAELLGDERKLSVRTYNAPEQAGPAVAAVWKSRTTLMTPIGGGVHIEPQMALQPENLLPDENGKVAELHGKVKLDIPEGRWWWD